MKRLSMFLTLACGASLGQQAVNTPSGLFRPAPYFGRQPFFNKVVTGQPFSAEFVNENVQTLADGSHVTQDDAAIRVYRDSFGRMREECSKYPHMAGARSASQAAMMVHIIDPVARVRYVVDTEKKVTHRQALLTGAEAKAGVEQPYVKPPAQPPERKAPETSVEKLEPQTIEGVQAEGRRATTTWPPGSRIGNEAALTGVVETWESRELQVILLVKTTDPRAGEQTEKLTNLSRMEPDPMLFQPPAEYTIVDEKEETIIK